MAQVEVPADARVVVGLGPTGLSCVRHLVSLGYPVIVNDSRDEPPGLTELREQFPNVPCVLGHFSRELMLAATELVLSPGTYVAEPSLAKCHAENMIPSIIEDVIHECQQRGIPCIGDIELFARAVSADVVAITGTNAKSTVTALVGELARAAGVNVQVGGNIGTPALDLLLAAPADLYVLEVSNVQLELTHSLQTKVATVLNISPDHMDRYVDVAEYAATKQRIYQDCHCAVINKQDQATWVQAPNQAAHTVQFSNDAPLAGEFGLRADNGQYFIAYGEENIVPVSALKIQGRHNWANAVAALAIGHACGLALPAMIDALTAFPGLAHRCQWVAEQNGVTWYNDSKGTNVGATLAALEGLGPTIKGKIILLAGGLAKGGDFQPLHSATSQYVRSAILFGQDAAAIAASLAVVTDIVHAQDLAQAVRLAAAQAQPGDIVLLSPICASFDMFKSYADRGEQFCALVKDTVNEL